MPKFKTAALFSVICLMGAVLSSWLVFSQTPHSFVRLSTEPPLNRLFPFEAEAATPQSPVTLTLQARDAANQPLEKAKIRLRILTPKKTPWFPTDFPIVEGTELLNIEAIAPNGELQIQQMLPIRGQYQLFVDVTPLETPAFTPFQQTLTLLVHEHGVKYRNFGILAASLLIIGLGGGWVLGGQQNIQEGEIAPQRVRLLLSGAIVVAIASLLFINVTAEIADSHPDGNYSHPIEPAILQSQGVKAQIVGETAATVGQLAKLGVQVVDTTTGKPATDVILNIKTTPVGDEWVAFAYQGMPDNQGKLMWEQQFFDGAPHKVTVEISSQSQQRQFSPLRVAQEIDVEGVAPPLQSRLIVLAYWTSFIVLGLVIGIKFKSYLIAG